MPLEQIPWRGILTGDDFAGKCKNIIEDNIAADLYRNNIEPGANQKMLFENSNICQTRSCNQILILTSQIISPRNFEIKINKGMND